MPPVQIQDRLAQLDQIVPPGLTLSTTASGRDQFVDLVYAVAASGDAERLLSLGVLLRYVGQQLPCHY